MVLYSYSALQWALFEKCRKKRKDDVRTVEKMKTKLADWVKSAPPRKMETESPQVDIQSDVDEMNSDVDAEPFKLEFRGS